MPTGETDAATSAATQTAQPARARPTLLLAGCFALVCLIWGTTWIAIKLAVTDMPPLTASGLRFVIAAPVFIGACRHLKIPMRYPRELVWFFVLMCAGYFAIPFFLYNFGEQHISSGLTAICFSSVSVLMVVFSVPILGSRITRVQFCSVVIAFVALGLLILHSQGVAVTSAWGVVAVLAAAVMHAYCYIMIKKYARGLHSLTINTLPMALAGLILTSLGLVIEQPGVSAFTARSVGATLYLGVVASVIGFAIYFWLVQRMNTVTVSFVFVLFPIVAQFFSVAVEGTAFSPVELMLTIVVLTAFGTTQWGQRRAGGTRVDLDPPATIGSPSDAGVDRAPTSDALTEIYRHAIASYPAECCGLVNDFQVKRCQNVIDERSQDRPEDLGRTTRTGYALEMADLRHLDESFDGDRPVRIIYHSHPDVGAYFSDEDHRHAVVNGVPVYPVRHLVVDVTADGVLGSRLFEFSSATGRYEECGVFGQPQGGVGTARSCSQTLR